MIRLWWFLRGVTGSNYRALCSRCYRTGQAHFSPWGCWRFK